jgi:hypothetical protein
MPTPPYDHDAESQRSKLSSQRRAWKRDVFENALVDWKSIPAIEMSEHDRDHLLRRPHMRCDSSRRHHAEVIAAARLRPLMTSTDTSPLADRTASLSLHRSKSLEPGKVTIIQDQGLTTIIIDDENMIDMIG